MLSIIATFTVGLIIGIVIVVLVLKKIPIFDPLESGGRMADAISKTSVSKTLKDTKQHD